MRIISDTASLFSMKQGEELGIKIIPACVINRDEVYRDYEDITSEQFLELVKSGETPTTSQPAIGDLIEVFEDEQEEVLALFIGDGLSGGYQNAVGAKNSVDNHEHIHVIDTKTLAGAEHYLVEKAFSLKKQGKTMKEIEAELQNSIEDSHSFVIPADFEFLKRSGRLTPLAAKISSMIKIVPVLTQTEDKKKITLFTIKRSWNKAVSVVVEQMKKNGVCEEHKIFICHGGDKAAAKLVKDQMKDFCKDQILIL